MKNKFGVLAQGCCVSPSRHHGHFTVLLTRWSYDNLHVLPKRGYAITPKTSKPRFCRNLVKGVKPSISSQPTDSDGNINLKNWRVYPLQFASLELEQKQEARPGIRLAPFLLEFRPMPQKTILDVPENPAPQSSWYQRRANQTATALANLERDRQANADALL